MRFALAAAILLASSSFATDAAAEETGRYQISATTDDWKRAWRIDTKTGEVSICSLAPDFSGCRKLPEGDPLPKSWRQGLEPPRRPER